MCLMSKGNVEIRIAEPRDNQGLIDLSHNCPMEADITVYPDRSPDYAVIQKLIDKDSYHSIGLLNGEIIGCLGCTYSEFQVNNEKIPGGVIADFKVAPDHRKSMVTFRVVKKVSDMEKKSKASIWIGLILANNKAPLPFIMGRVGFPKTVYVGRFNVMNFIPLRNFRIDPKFEIRKATIEDIPEMSEVYMKFYSRHHLTPYFTDKSLHEIISIFKGLEIENFYLAIENGKIKAVMAAWDQSFYKRLVVESFNLGPKLLILLCRFLSLFMKVPELPKKNKHLKVINVVMTAHDNSPDGYTALVKFLNNKYRGSEFPLLTFYMKSDNPLKKCFKGMLGASVGTDCYVSTENKDINKTLLAELDKIHLEWQVFL